MHYSIEKRIGCMLGALLAIGAVSALAQTPAGTSFTYQGKLNLSASLLSNTADFEFTLWNDAASLDPNAMIGSTVDVSGVDVVTGLFTVQLDFGVAAFDGDARWLQIAVRSPAGSGTYTTLSPRQRLTPAPYALALRGLRTLETGDDPNFPGSWNILGGHPDNTIDPNAAGVVIAGGGSAQRPNQATAPFATVGGGQGNEAAGTLTTIAGGVGNYADGEQATIGGGRQNAAPGLRSAVGGGFSNNAAAADAVVAGGNQNLASGTQSAVGGGLGNVAGGTNAVVAGGTLNQAGGQSAAVGGGESNQAHDQYATIAGGTTNSAGMISTIGGGSGNNASDLGTVGGGQDNNASGGVSVVAGGAHNSASAQYATVGGGIVNHATGITSVVSGGSRNNASGASATVGGGEDNQATGLTSVVPGGNGNQAQGESSFAAGAAANATHDHAFVWSDGGSFASTGPNQFLINSAGGVGINKDDPNTALDVAGTVTADAFVGDGSGLTGVTVPGDNLGDHTATQALNMATFDIANAGTVTANTFVGDGSGLTGIAAGDSSYGSSANSPNNAVFVNDAGQVSIGAAPGAALAVNGSAVFLNPTGSPSGSNVSCWPFPGDVGFVFDRGDGNGNVAQRWETIVTTDNSFRLVDRTHNQDRLIVDTAGQVGIGISIPTETLDVAGSARISGNVGIGGFSPGKQLYVYGSTQITGEFLANSSANINGNLTVAGGTFQVSGYDGVGVGSVPANTDFNVQNDGENTVILDATTSDGSSVFRVQADDNVVINGNLQVLGSKSFILDHPLDPVNKNLVHNAVEGPGYYTMYKGRVTLQQDGTARIQLPDYFEALNTDVDYHLTPIGAAMPNLHVATEVYDNAFTIAGGKPGLTVSWMVTATRNDPWAQDHPFQTVTQKEGAQCGRLFYPQGYGYPEEMSISRTHEDACTLADE